MTDIEVSVIEENINISVGDSQPINISLDIAGARNLDELNDVTLTSLSDNDRLVYNSTSGQWENSISGALIWGNITGNLPDQIDLQSALDLKYDSADFTTDFNTNFTGKSTTDLSEGTNLYYTEVRVTANTDVAANTLARHNAVTITDGSTINFTLSGQDITAETIDSAINHDLLLNYESTEHFLQSAISIPASQISDFDTEVSNNSSVTANTAKVTNVSTDLSAGTLTATTIDVNSSDGTNATLIEADTTNAGILGSDKWDEIVANTAKVTNATHTGDVTGNTSLTIGIDKIKDIMIDFGTGVNQVSTADLPEQTNLYYTEGRVSANTNVSANTTHKNSDGTDHTYINQDLRTTTNPTFTNVTSSNNASANSHLVRLDQMNDAIQGIHWQDAVEDQINFVTSEPGAPSTGDRYINTATGDSSGTTQAVIATYIYEWDGSTWDETISVEGMAVWDKIADTNYTFNGSSWVEFGSTISHNNTSGLQGGTSGEYYHLSSSQHTDLTGGGDTTLHDHDGISENTTARHAESHSIVSHNDTTATGSELDTLTDNSIADTLHRHSELVASDGSPDPALSVDIDGKVGIGTSNPEALLEVKGESSVGSAIRITDDSSSRYLEMTHGNNEGNLFTVATSTKLNLGIGASQMTILANGNVGIGTTSPSSLLTVGDAPFTVTSDDAIQIASAGDTHFIMGEDANNNGRLQWDASENSWEFKITDGGVFRDNILVLASDGNVGIGTSNPSNKFEIKSSGASTNPLFIENSANTNILFQIREDGSGDGQMNFYNLAGVSNVQLHTDGDTFFNGGNVGIGTSSPSDILHSVKTLNAGVANQLALSNLGSSAGTATQIRFSMSSNLAHESAAIRAIRTNTVFTGATDFAFLTRNSGGTLTENMRIQNDGNVGIGTSSPKSQLQITTNQGTNRLIISDTRSTTGDTAYIEFSTGTGETSNLGKTAIGHIETGGYGRGDLIFALENLADADSTTVVDLVADEKMRITSEGNVGIGTSSPYSKLDIAETTPYLTVKSTFNGAWNENDIVGGINFRTSDTSGIGVHNMARIISINDRTIAGTTIPAGALAFHVSAYNTEASEAMRITSTGNVGIGTSSPLAVNGGRAMEISSITGADLILERVDEEIGVNDHVGGLAFKNTDVSGSPPNYAGIKATSSGTSSRMNLEFYAGRTEYEVGTSPHLFISGSTADTGNVGIGTDSPNTLLDVQGGQTVNITTVNAATYDLLITDYILNITYTGTGAVTSLTLPTAQTVAGRVIIIKDAGGNAGTNNITIDTEASQNIDGSATNVISSNYGSVKLYCDGTNWFII